MSFSICKGYLLTKVDYQIFDEIITFLTETGNLFTCLSRGTRKIASKNARNLIYFSLIEFEFFNSRQPNTIGKLMRAKRIENEDSSKSYISSTVNNVSLLFINEIICNQKLSGLSVYNFYKTLMETKIEHDDNYVLVIYSLIKLVKILGWKITLDKCAICSKKKIFNFSPKAYGFVCNDCNSEYFTTDKNVIKILFYVAESKYLNASDFDNKYKKMTIKVLMNYYYETLAINLYSLLLVF
ncbi:MAG: DNA repair protein RecO [Malacoplasma sp.]